MRISLPRALVLAAAALWLAACSSTNGTGNPFLAASTDAAKPAAPAQDQALASADAVAPAPSEAGLLGSDANDELSLGKKSYRAGDYGNAERHFRKAAESHPRDAEAWLGLAASYDRLRRFDLADRAYREASRIVGETAEILNNEGYSYMLRGDYARAHAKLLAAQRLEPENRYVANNLRLLADSQRLGKAVR